MKNMMSKAKQIMVMALALCMMLTTLGGYTPGWFSAFAEDAAVQAEAAPMENPTSDQEEETIAANEASPEGEASGEEAPRPMSLPQRTK